MNKIQGPDRKESRFFPMMSYSVAIAIDPASNAKSEAVKIGLEISARPADFVFPEATPVAAACTADPVAFDDEPGTMTWEDGNTVAARRV